MDTVADGNDTVTVGGVTRHVYGYLEDFLFPPERARSPVKALSGGERGRLLLARLLTRPANVLILDEPTNDLDIETLELLEAELAAFDGTLLIVSHDRSFLDNVVTSTLVFTGDGRIEEHLGGYEQWQRERALAAPPEMPAPTVAREPRTAQPGTGNREQVTAAKKLSYRERLELEGLPAPSTHSRPRRLASKRRPRARTSTRSRPPPSRPLSSASTRCGRSLTRSIAAGTSWTRGRGDRGRGRRRRRSGPAIFVSAGGQAVTVIETTEDGGRRSSSAAADADILPETLAPGASSRIHRRRSSAILCSWPLREQRAFFERDVGIPLKFEPDPGKWFPVSDRALDVRNGLGITRRQRVEFRFKTELVDVVPFRSGFIARASRGELDAPPWSSRLAAFGPATGSTGTGLTVARALGTPSRHVSCAHAARRVATDLASLAGVSAERRSVARVVVGDTETHGGFLFTIAATADRPCSTYRTWPSQRHGQVAAALASAGPTDEAAWPRQLVGATGFVTNVVAAHAAKRMADALVAECGFGRPLGNRIAPRGSDQARGPSPPWGSCHGRTTRLQESRGDRRRRGARRDGPANIRESPSPISSSAAKFSMRSGLIGGHNFAWAWETGAAGMAPRDASSTTSASEWARPNSAGRWGPAGD